MRVYARIPSQSASLTLLNAIINSLVLVVQLTRALRARLGYASYKATHDLSRSNIRDLEAQTPSQPISYPRPNIFQSGSPHSIGRKGSMGPPAPVTASAGQSLFASLLGPPPAKRARTIRNPEDPPVPPPLRPTSTASTEKRAMGSSERSRASKSTINTSVAERTRSHDKQEKRDGRKRARAARKPRTKGSGLSEVDDMNAAKTLTSLLMHSRPGAGSTSSPRSTMSALSDGDSSYSHFAESSSRTFAGPSPINLSNNSSTPPPPVHHTPGTRPPKVKRGDDEASRPGPSDSEAAEIMMFLATSPSPARPTAAKDRDAEAYRVLGGGARVLFPGVSDTPSQPKSLRRDQSGSFASTISAIGDMGGGSLRPSQSTAATDIPSRDEKVEGMQVDVIPPTPTDIHPSGSGPFPPGSPGRSSAMPSTGYTPLQLLSRHTDSPQTPANFHFHLSEYLNVSPSPLVPPKMTLPPLTSSKTEVGRRLFEDEHRRSGSPTHAMGSGGPLGSGIDIVRTVS